MTCLPGFTRALEQKEIEMHTQNMKQSQIQTNPQAKEEKMQMECSSVRREMACCAALDRLE